MKSKNFAKTTVVFILSIFLSSILFYFDLGLGIATIFILTVLVFIASYLDSDKEFLLSLGFQKKKATLKNLLIYAPITAFIILMIYRFLLVPIVTKFTGVPIDISAFDPIRGNLSILLSTLVLVWTSAAFGEEIIFRGYFMTRFSKVFGNSSFSVVANVILFAIFFGAIHAYQGLTGQILSGLTGAIIAILFHLKRNDLWFCIVVHGMIDTFAFIAVYLNIF
ncbi:type II CAAX endopeptidase family protein [Pseudotenacibaculum sp. MALMAid0570]|uniref:CPBP family intramembrane glutamic endopeptidase n=1 Tax=Pseudotenacibaculum sp. MALMAid0570 TaxID=3143938 RepID=UPI0032DF47B4